MPVTSQTSPRRRGLASSVSAVSPRARRRRARRRRGGASTASSAWSDASRPSARRGTTFRSRYARHGRPRAAADRSARRAATPAARRPRGTSLRAYVRLYHRGGASVTLTRIQREEQAGWASTSARLCRTACACSPRRSPTRSRSPATSCCGRIALRERVEPRDRALRRAHVLQGDGAAPDRARPDDRRRRDRRRVQRLHLEGVHRLLHPLRRRAARHRARRARRHAAQLEVRPRGARAREGRDPRGDEHVLRHAARLRRRRSTRSSSSATNPLGWETLGTKRDDQGGDARDVHRLPRALVHAGSAWSSASRAWSATTCSRGSKSCSATSAATAPAHRCRPRSTARPRPRVRLHTKDSDQAQICTRRPDRTRSTHPDRYALQLLGTVLGTGMSSRLFLEVRERRGLAYYVYGLNSSLHRRRHALRAGRRRPRSASTRRSSVIAEQFRGWLAEPVPDGRAREGARARQGPLRPADREPERAAALRPAARGARGPGGRAGGAARRARRRHRRGRPARRAGRDRRTAASAWR